jgi:phage tail-like protein
VRGLVTGLGTPVPLLDRLPGILQEDEFLGRWLEGFDDSLAPVLAVLDNLDAYLRPETAPPDFLAWLAGWVDVRIDEAWPLDQARRVVAEAAVLARRAGTADGIRAAMTVAAGPGARVEVAESGGTAWSVDPHGPLPGTADAEVRIDVAMPAGDVAELQRRLERAARRVVPAHVRCLIEVSVGAS